MNPSRSFTIGKTLLMFIKALEIAFDGPDETDDRQEVEDIAGECESTGGMLLIEGRGFPVQLHQLGDGRGTGLFEVRRELSHAHRQKPALLGRNC